MHENMKQERLHKDAGVAVSAMVDLRILETTDLHVHLHPYDYYADCPNPDLGLSRLAELVDVARQQSPNCLLFDNGDFLQGTPVGDFLAYDKGLKDGDVHPVMEAMNALRYDALTLGNHEFNYGVDFLLKTLMRADSPVVSANILRSNGGSHAKDLHLVRPYSLLHRNVVDRSGQRHPLCIGVIGVAPPQITIWERQILNGRVQTRDMVSAVRAFIPEMREAGADLIVLLAHSGIGAIRHTENMENAVIPLAAIDGVDVVLSGHSHQIFPSRSFADIPGVDIARGTICGKPTVMSGFFGSHLGVIDLTLIRDGGRWVLLSSGVETRSLRDAARRFTAPELPERNITMNSPKVRKIVERTHQAVLANIRQPIGATRTAINSFFVYLGQSAATALVAQAQQAYVDKHLRGTAFEGMALLSAVSPSKAGGLAGPRNYTNIDAGQLTWRSLADLYIYPNRIAALRLSGADIRLWLERTASAYHQIHAGLDQQPLMNPAHPGYNFEIIYGLTYDIDLSQPARFNHLGELLGADHFRIRNLCFQGQPLDPDQQFILCTNSFRAHGAGGFAGAEPEAVVFENNSVTRDILRDFVAERGALSIPASGPFRLCPIAQARAVLSTGVAAHAHLDLIAQHEPEVLGVDGRGFLRVSLKL